jgi:SAM-dependent methyltransferase
MYNSVYDLKAFYNSKTGRVIRRVLQTRIREFWPDVKGLDVLGCGYSVPYLRGFQDDGASRVFAVMPARQGVHHWPPDGKNLACLAEDTELPIETASVDRIILIHHLEFTELPPSALGEIWRVMKANGRVLAIVPNRTGFWSRAVWSPFGHGTPYTATQLVQALHENLFVHERTEEALFMPPLRYSPALKSAGFFETTGRSFFPFIAGVHMIEASKQLYARAGDGGAKVRVRGRGLLGVKPLPVPQG